MERRWIGRRIPWLAIVVVAASLALLAGCRTGGGPAGEPRSPTPVPVPATASPRVPVLLPPMRLDDFRRAWNEAAARSAASDPFGIAAFDPEPGATSVRKEWPDAGMALEVSFDPDTTLVAAVTLARAPTAPGREAFVHGMAVVITAWTPGLSTERRVAVYEGLGEACDAAGNGPFTASMVAGDLRFTLSSTGAGDATLRVTVAGRLIEPLSA